MQIRKLIQSSFAILKANKKVFTGSIDTGRLAKCRQLLEMSAVKQQQQDKAQSQELSIQEIEAYMRERSEKTSSLHSKQIFNKWEIIKPLQFEIGLLAKRKQFGQFQDKYVKSIMKFWTELMIEEKSKVKEYDNQFYALKKILKQYFTAFYGLIYLMNIDENMAFLFLRAYNSVQSLKLYEEQKNMSQLRFVFDKIITFPSLSEQNLQFLAYFISRYTPHHFYFQRQLQIMTYFFNQLPNSWSSNIKHAKILTPLINCLFNYTASPPHITKELPSILKNYRYINIRFQAFMAMLQLMMIDKNNINENSFYDGCINSFMEQIPKFAFPRLSRLFYYAGIWKQIFWVKFFQFMMIGDNYKLLFLQHHYIILDLLINGTEAPHLKPYALKMKQFLKQTKNIDVDKMNIRDELQRNHGRAVENKNGLQLHIANSMRLICGAEVLTQVPVKYFIVDVLIDKNIIVEINSGHHYKIINGKKVLNLRSQFRERILSDMGYVYHNVEVEDFTNSDYTFMQQVHQIVGKTKRMKANYKPLEIVV